MSKKTKLILPANCSIEPVGTAKRDRAFQLRFQADEGEDYVSEIYVPGKGESLKRAAYNVCVKFDWLDEPPGKKDRLITSLADFLDWRGCGDDPYSWARAYYKYTACGPWVNFLELVTPARDVDHPAVIAILRRVRGKVKLMNPQDVDPSYLQLLSLDEQGLPTKERTWDVYCGLVATYVADEAKQARTKKTLEIVKQTPTELHLRQPARTQHIEAEIRKVYYEDIGKTLYSDETWMDACGCTLASDGPHPDDPAEDVYVSKEPDPECHVCRGAGQRKRRRAVTIPGPDGRPVVATIQVDPDKCVGIEFGSIVEGSDVCSGPFTHMFPFSKEDWARDEKYMEAETSYFWTRDNSQWYHLQVLDQVYELHNTWGEITWDTDKPSPKLVTKVEAFIREHFDEIPREPGMWATPKKGWEPAKIPGTRATIHEWINDLEF